MTEQRTSKCSSNVTISLKKKDILSVWLNFWAFVYKKQKSISGWVFRFSSSDICYMCTLGTCLCSYVECVNIDIKLEGEFAFF